MSRCFWAGLLAAVMLMGCGDKSTDYGAIFEDIAEGDIVEFGTYEQDGFRWNGQEPIRWEVLEIKEGQAVLISESCLTIKPMNEKRAVVTWEDCSLRKWLNDDFYNEAFTETEQELIAQVALNNGDSYSNDLVFLLSLEELEHYYGEGYQDKDGSRVPMTKYTAGLYPWDAIAKNFKDKPKEGDGITWWLRTPGKDRECFEVVDGFKQTYADGQAVNESNTTGVRPVIVIDLDNID